MQIKCLDSLPSHLPRTYHEVGEFACGQTGRALVSVVTTLEYFGYACMQLILLWHQLEVSPCGCQHIADSRRLIPDLSAWHGPCLCCHHIGVLGLCLHAADSALASGGFLQLRACTLIVHLLPVCAVSQSTIYAPRQGSST